jgi:thymidylate synthase, flavin-dependent
MKITEASAKLMNPFYDEICDDFYLQLQLKHVEKCGRICYLSEPKDPEGSTDKFIRMLIKNGHESPLEHGGCTFKIVTDRAISQEVVRHRLASYSQESTRYCNYANGKFSREITVIESSGLAENEAREWLDAMEHLERTYLLMIDSGVKPEKARDVLPLCLKTELMMTANFREWRHFLKLRGSRMAHPGIRKIAKQIYEVFQRAIPVLVEDIELADVDD